MVSSLVSLSHDPTRAREVSKPRPRGTQKQTNVSTYVYPLVRDFGPLLDGLYVIQRVTDHECVHSLIKHKDSRSHLSEYYVSHNQPQEFYQYGFTQFNHGLISYDTWVVLFRIFLRKFLSLIRFSLNQRKMLF